MWQTYFQPQTLTDALTLLHEHGSNARLVAGGTDLLVELQRGVRPTSTVVDLCAVAGLKYIREENGIIHMGALATHNDVVASPLCVERALPLAQACWEVGAPQIRTRATIAGNLVTASPANDTITPLMALEAEVVLTSLHGERVLPLRDFYLGVRRTALQPGELLREIRFPAMRPGQRGLFLKLGLRRAQAISVINVCVIVEGENREPRTKNQEPRTENQSLLANPQSPIANRQSPSGAKITMGCVAPTIVRAAEAEAFVHGKTLMPEVCAEAGQLALQAIAPIDDLRGSADYRRHTVAALVAQALARLAAGTEREGWPEQPVLLETGDGRPKTDDRQAHPVEGEPYMSPLQLVQTSVNDVPHTWADASHKTLLDALRENAGLTGTKEGCGEGECGACTVWLNGQAVMACLVPAAQAHGGAVVTIEGLAPTEAAPNGSLHPLQQAFIEQGAVQCGYCIPGMLMAGAKLLDEHATPDMAQVQSALSGNICRCTGYRKIFAAMHQAAGSDH